MQKHSCGRRRHALGLRIDRLAILPTSIAPPKFPSNSWKRDMGPRPIKLLEQVRDGIRLKPYCPGVEDAYVCHGAHHHPPALSSAWPCEAHVTSQKPIHNSQSAIRNSPVLAGGVQAAAGAPALFPLLCDRRRFRAKPPPMCAGMIRATRR